MESQLKTRKHKKIEPKEEEPALPYEIEKLKNEIRNYLYGLTDNTPTEEQREDWLLFCENYGFRKEGDALREGRKFQ